MSENVQENERFLPPTQIQTSTPYISLKELSKQYSVPVEFIDFKILDILTYYKNKDNEEPVFVPEENLDFFDDNAFYLDETLEIEQFYDVEFFDVRLNAVPKLPKIEIGVNSTVTKVVAKVKATKDCEYEQHYEDKLFEYIAKQLMKAQILIGIRIGKLKDELKQIASVVHVKGELDKDYILNITQGINPKKATDAKILYCYKDKLDAIKEEDKVDYADRGFVFGVAQDEVIMEEKKSHEGQNGRDARGKLLAVEKPKEDTGKEISISENIERVENDDSIIYIAKKSGYVVEKNGSFDIEERIEINEANFKTTGSIQAGTDTNVTLVVRETDTIKDAIGTGIIVEADEIEVKGNVGANAMVKANEVVIGGQTHQKAKIYAKNAKISIHIGKVEAENVEIDRLEGGNVVAKRVKINSVVGGSITAQNIQINTLGSNCTITASHLIDVRYLRGTDNKFIIDTSKMPESAEATQEQLNKIEYTKAELASLLKNIETKKNVINENKDSIYTIKAKVEELSKAKVIPPVTFMKKLKEYQGLVNEYNTLLKIFKDKKELLATLKDELEIMQNGIFSAKVINRGNWVELNEIRFVIVDPPQNVTYISKQNETAHAITLEKIGDGDEAEYKIKKSNKLEDYTDTNF
ncbi:flagellar assembly protein A [Campylobacter concisus]|uniref:flagellar assembly protein A n=1 Tax=Campylobacter concisus TaxID=199 RepID=UPI000CD87F98|nr:flagellar assembly protein A [Campylobacter concisus]